MAIRVAGVERGVELARGERGGLGQRLAQAGDRAAALALEHRGGKVGTGEQGGGELDCGVELGGRGQAAQRHAGAVVVGAAGELDAEIGLAVGDGLLVEPAGAGVEQGLGHARQPGLALGVERAAGSEGDLDVDQRQRAALDEVHPRAGGRGPFDDLGGGERAGRRAGTEYERGGAQEMEAAGAGGGALEAGGFCGHGGHFVGVALQWRGAAKDERGRLSPSGCGSRRAVLRLASSK